jgi:hypothetical protein
MMVQLYLAQDEDVDILTWADFVEERRMAVRTFFLSSLH